MPELSIDVSTLEVLQATAMNDWAEFRHFRYLLVILEKQSFRVAAEELNSSQPNLTVQARQFQENAAVRLFRKSRNGRIRPTETGFAFIALARLLLTTRDEVVEALRAIERGEIRALRFGCNHWADQNVFRDLCAIHREIIPACTILPTYEDIALLAEAVLTGDLDAAVVSLPLEHPDLHIEVIRKERLVVCLRKDDPLAHKIAVLPADLQGKLSILFSPHRHPEAHERLLELLSEAGLTVLEYSVASSLFEIQMLVKDGHGVALVREGSVLDAELTTRPVAGVSWTVDTAVIYRAAQHPKTIPVALKTLQQRYKKQQKMIVVPKRHHNHPIPLHVTTPRVREISEEEQAKQEDPLLT